MLTENEIYTSRSFAQPSEWVDILYPVAHVIELFRGGACVFRFSTGFVERRVIHDVLEKFLVACHR